MSDKPIAPSWAAVVAASLTPNNTNQSVDTTTPPTTPTTSREEILKRWSAEQILLSQQLRVGDDWADFQMPLYDVNTADHDKLLAMINAKAAKNKSKQQSSQSQGATDIIGCASDVRFPIPPTPIGTVPCVWSKKGDQKGKDEPVSDVETSNDAESKTSPKNTLPPLTVVAGIDISFVKDSDLAVASLAILSFPELKLLHSEMKHVTMTEPYISGFLAFREVPLVAPFITETIAKLPKKLHPQVIFVDGNGVHHPRKFGFASHLGVVLDIPTIGCAKKLLAVDGLSTDGVLDELRQWVEVDKKGPIMPLIGGAGKINSPTGGNTASDPSASPSQAVNLKLVKSQGGGAAAAAPPRTFWGYAALTGGSTKNPIYCSPGHKMGYQQAMILTILVTLFRVPEPIRQADLLSREYIRQHFGGK